MKIRLPVIGVGLVIITIGIIFYLQGISVIGPTSSFMYSNPKWIIYGQQIAGIGMAILALGIWFSLRRLRS